MRMRSVMLFVQDIEWVAAFYEDYFGLIRTGASEEGYLELDAGGVRLALHAAKWCHGDNSDSPAKIVFECQDVHAAVAAFQEERPYGFFR